MRTAYAFGRHYLHTGKRNDKPNHDFRVGTMGNVRSQDDIHTYRFLLLLNWQVSIFKIKFLEIMRIFLNENLNKNSVSLKTPNLQYFCLTPPELGDRSF